MSSVRTTVRFTAFGAALLLAGCANPFRIPTDAASAPRGGPGDIAQVAHAEVGDRTAPLQHEGLAAAEDLYRREQFDKAEDRFEAIADDTKNRAEVAERARYYQAESLRRQGYYPKAVDAYHKLLKDFPAGLYREQAVGQMYLIAGEWLQPVRDEIEAAKNPNDPPKKSWVDSVVFVNFDRKLPTIDVEGRALQTLEQVYFNDPTGPNADRALFMLGRVHYERKNFREAARFFQQLVETNARSPLVDEALKMAIISKNASTGGPDHDGRDVAEAMRLINTAKATSPALAREDNGQFLDKQALMVRYQQAEKDYETAEFYRRTGHPGSAWFCYELVKRRYPGIKPWAENAVARQAELKADLDDMNSGSTAGSTRRFWKQYVLGHDLPADKTVPTGNVLKDLPEPAAPSVPPSALPAEIRPR